ncbi:KxYKxGKxW signal peptide domain-containing protein [Lacticaseibacillus suilingensis]|uniref:KxYKxGKxW signal peptide domain-containing protein n=1 Tax=Lacticaseibacillus suilingensis TaxID=2799577 RepID=A0ABW4BL86_9LACO|nr:KxYKxGKxW signal peptide domain-containing protein [Lacticaseibacillus suilingensis]
MGKKTGSSGDIFRNNSKVRFKMFKAGKRWLVAGTATLSGLLGGLLIAPHAVNADTTTPTVAKTVDQQDTLATQDTATIPVSSQTGSQTTSTDASASIEASTSTSVSISQSASESALVSESASQSGSTTESESSSTQSSTSSSTSTATSTSATSASSVAVKAATTADTTQTLGTQLGLGAKDTASVKDGQLTINVTDDASLTAPVLANIARYVSANAVNTTVILTAGAQITSRDGKVSVLILNGATAVSSIQDGKNLASAIGQVTGKVPTVEGIAATAAVSEAMAGYTTKSGAGLSILGVQISTGWDQEPSSQNVAIGQNAILIGTVSTAISEAFGQALTNAATSAISLGTISFKPTYKLYSSTGGSWTDTGLTSSTGVFSVLEFTIEVEHQIKRLAH